MQVRKSVLKPGTFEKRDAQGNVVATKTITPEMIQAFPATFEKLKSKGLYSPLVFEHPTPTPNGEGTPQKIDVLRQRNSDITKNTAGWTESYEVKDGSLFATYEIPDETEAAKFADNRIRFISPEIRDVWFDADGERHENVITHHAATHSPVDKGQTPGFELVPAVQFSDLENPALTGVFQFADSGNPDMPADNGGAETAKAIIANLKVLGVELPDATDFKGEAWMDVMLAALKTAAAAKQKADADDAATQGGESPIVAMSDAEVALNDKVKALETQLAGVKAEKSREASISKINACKIPAAVRNELIADLATVQFSDTGDAQPTYTAEQFAEKFAKHIPANFQFGDASDLQTPPNPNPDFNTPLDGNAKLEKEAEEQTKKYVEKRVAVMERAHK